MAIHERRSYTVHVVEYVVPNGSAESEYDAARSAALAEWRKIHPDVNVPADWATVHARHGGLTIRIAEREV